VPAGVTSELSLTVFRQHLNTVLFCRSCQNIYRHFKTTDDDDDDDDDDDLYVTESASSADNAAATPHKPRRRRNNRANRPGNKRASASRPLHASSQQPDQTAQSGGNVLENGVADSTRSNDSSSKLQSQPHNKTTHTEDAATVATKN